MIRAILRRFTCNLAGQGVGGHRKTVLPCRVPLFPVATGRGTPVPSLSTNPQTEKRRSLGHRLLSHLLGCRHKGNRTFPQTREGRTYQVCLDCGKEFPYDWFRMRPGHQIYEDLNYAAYRAVRWQDIIISALLILLWVGVAFILGDQP